MFQYRAHCRFHRGSSIVIIGSGVDILTAVGMIGNRTYRGGFGIARGCPRSIRVTIETIGTLPPQSIIITVVDSIISSGNGVVGLGLRMHRRSHRRRHGPAPLVLSVDYFIGGRRDRRRFGPSDDGGRTGRRRRYRDCFQRRIVTVGSDGGPSDGADGAVLDIARDGVGGGRSIRARPIILLVIIVVAAGGSNARFIISSAAAELFQQGAEMRIVGIIGWVTADGFGLIIVIAGAS